MFIGAMAWLANSCLGMYYVFTRTARKKEYVDKNLTLSPRRGGLVL
jgi:hypothetical protein